MTTYPYGGEDAHTLTPNGEQEYYGPNPSGGTSPFSLSNGVLDITASKAAAGSNPYGLPYTSGLITTHGSYAQTYGYFEVRAELPAGQGLWPAFWMLPVAVHDNTELDVFEVLGSSPSTLYGSTHGTSGGVSQPFTVPNTSAAFHTYGVDWEPDNVTFYMDGAKIGATATPASMNVPMYMLLNLAVGGATSWPGAPNASTVFPATMQIDYVRAYATANTTYSSGSAALPALPGQINPGASAPAFQPTVIVGSGPDVLALQVAGDAWYGDAQYTVSVDGAQVGAMQVATAIHGAGATQALDVLGSFGAGTHTVTVNFLNDASGGTAAADRNFYVTQASIDNTTITGGSLSEYSGGPQSFTFQGVAASTDTLVLGVSEDAWNGDAQYTVSVDGKQAGGVYTATASHAAGRVGLQTITGSFGSGPHTVGVTFINDAWGGSAATDRNLYVNSASYDGVAVATSTVGQYWNGTATVTTAATTAAISSLPSAPLPDTLTLGVSEDAWNGDAQYTVSVDGKQAGGVYTATASHAAGLITQQTITGSFGKGAHTIGVTFINDASAGTATTDRNLYVNAVNYDGAQVAMGTVAQYWNGTASIMTPAAADPNILTLHLAETTSGGDAQFTVAIDGQQVGGVQTVTAPNTAGTSQAFSFASTMAAGAHDVAVSFLNGLAGAGASGRTLYVAGADLNGVAQGGAVQAAAVQAGAVQGGAVQGGAVQGWAAQSAATQGAAAWTATLGTTGTSHFGLVVT